MSENINKYLLSQFYGLNENSVEVGFLSSSNGIESFENITKIEYPSVKHLLSSEETGKNQNIEEDSDRLYDEKDERSLLKSPHILTVEDFIDEIKNDSQDSYSEAEIIDDFKDDKNIPTKNFTRLEDTFTKAMAKISETPLQENVNSIGNNCSSNLSSDPVTRAKKLWRQKTIFSKENILSSQQLLSKFDGIHLDLNNIGICTFPVDLLQQVSNLQMLYLDSNNLTSIPDEFFTTLKYLKWLDIRNNQVTIIPPSIKGHAYLETLLLQGNNIEKLPLELGLVPNLKNMQIANNPIIYPPSKILYMDCARIVNFLRIEWNKEHPNEIIELKKINNDVVEKKPSTIICYQSNSKKKFSKSHGYKHLQNTPKTSIRLKTWNYKPSNRCQSAGDNTFQQKILWMTTAKTLLCQETAKLQKLLLAKYTIFI